MTERQKEAVRILNRLKEPVVKMGDVIREAAISEEEYFTLLEFVVESEPQMTYIPYPQPTITPQPLDPVYGKFGKVTCDDYNVVTVPCAQNMEEQE